MDIWALQGVIDQQNKNLKHAVAKRVQWCPINTSQGHASSLIFFAPFSPSACCSSTASRLTGALGVPGGGKGSTPNTRCSFWNAIRRKACYMWGGDVYDKHANLKVVLYQLLAHLSTECDVGPLLSAEATSSIHLSLLTGV